MICGNIIGNLQIKTTAKNEIGESIENWVSKYSIKGFIDLMSGSSNYLNFNSKLQESTHVFICDYLDLSSIKATDARMIVNSKIYDVLLIDDPMELHQHIEIYLKYIGE